MPYCPNQCPVSPKPRPNAFEALQASFNTKERSMSKLLLAIMLVALSSNVYAQSTATLQGSVKDQSGAVVSGAKVTVRNLATGVERIVQTGSNGNYQAAALLPGVYQVEARAQGFAPQAIDNLTLEVSQIAVHN